MSESISRVPAGMRYHSGYEARVRREVETTIMSVFDGWSYEEVTTPAIDYYGLFERGMGEDARRAFRFTDLDGSLLALRPDVTSSIARAAATIFADRSRPLRFCYAANVYRQRPRSHPEKQRETTQLGCELIGFNSIRADLEILAILIEVLLRLDLPASCITISSAKFINGIMESMGLSAAQRETMRELLDSKNTAELECFLGPFAPERERTNFAEVVRLSGKREVIEKSREVVTNSCSAEALNEIENIWGAIESMGLGHLFEIDLGDVRGLDYYTGLVFKIYLEGSGTRVGRGGRYDELIANFGKPEPAIGFVLDLDAVVSAVARRDRDRRREPTPDTTLVLANDPQEVFQSALLKRAAGKRIRIQSATPEKQCAS